MANVIIALGKFLISCAIAYAIIKKLIAKISSSSSYSTTFEGNGLGLRCPLFFYNYMKSNGKNQTFW